ncbi:Beta-Ala-Xaa dipeptidase [Streptococcus intermedius]|uniref:Beta-Ala-Xaa dipeptidase n=1 Tax=Streptococcus intermedius TaxID=1338 RepID=A0AAE8G1Z4_STRIT|nr:Beta-Ala-Xaa dipeptidase [Streptococcus intermedius]
MHLSHNGMKLGIANHDEQMGDLTINLGLANFNLQHGGKLVIDIRYPKSITPNEMTKAILQVGEESQQFEVIEQKPPHYVSGSSPLVKKLLDIYEEQTGQKGSERVIGGATYARLLKEGVAFGALFPTTQDTMHQADEHIPVADLLKATAIYAQAIAELACM